MGRCLGTCRTVGAGLRTNRSSFTAIAKASGMTRHRFAGSTVVTNHSASTLGLARLCFAERPRGREGLSPRHRGRAHSPASPTGSHWVRAGSVQGPTEDWRAARGAMSQVEQAHEAGLMGIELAIGDPVNGVHDVAAAEVGIEENVVE